VLQFLAKRIRLRFGSEDGKRRGEWFKDSPLFDGGEFYCDEEAKVENFEVVRILHFDLLSN
jgi:hypothetical protein